MAEDDFIKSGGEDSPATWCERHGDVGNASFTLTLHGVDSPPYCARCMFEMIDKQCCILTRKPLDGPGPA